MPFRFKRINITSATKYINCVIPVQAGIQETNQLDYPVELGNDKDEESVQYKLWLTRPCLSLYYLQY